MNAFSSFKEINFKVDGHIHFFVFVLVFGNLVNFIRVNFEVFRVLLYDFLDWPFVNLRLLDVEYCVKCFFPGPLLGAFILFGVFSV